MIKYVWPRFCAHNIYFMVNGDAVADATATNPFNAFSRYVLSLHTSHLFPMQLFNIAHRYTHH